MAGGDKPREATMKSELLDMLPAEIIADMEILSPHRHNEIMSLSLRDAREKFETEYLKVQISRFDGNT